MFKIGEFARMGQVSVRTLRHYEEIGLLAPMEIDRFSGYRYYSTRQLPRLNRIVFLKGLGFSLEQIGQILDAGLSPPQLKEIISQKQAEVRLQLEQTQNLLMRLESWLSQTGGSEMITNQKYEVTIKRVEPMLVASLRQTIPLYGRMDILFGKVREHLANFGVGHAYPAIVIWHFSNPPEEDGFEVEVAEQLDKAIPSTEQVKVYTLPSLELAASVLHYGALDTANDAYQSLGNWVEDNGYRVCGPTRQIHHRFDPKANPETYITEFQLPIEK